MSLDKLLLFLSRKTLALVIFALGNYNYYYDYVSTSCGEISSSIFSGNQGIPSYDFIVVGGGSAGAVIANRLSKNNKVLLIEAGGHAINLHQYPGLSPDLINFAKLENWNYETVPQKFSSFAIRNNISLQPRGKALGGSSILNHWKYVRGHPLDYEQLANATGDESWKYENLLPYFKKSLQYHGRFSENKKHYESGPYGFLHVEDRDHRPLYDYLIGAAKEFGYEEVDLNGPQRTGFGTLEVTQKHGYRTDTSTAFLKPILGRKNLVLSLYSQAYKIDLDENNNARGVWFLQHGREKYAKANKEIIVSAGAFDSPKLLMLSGIGIKEHLYDLKIKPKVDLPVGNNLYDHFAVILPGFLIDKPLSFRLERDFNYQMVKEFITTGKGAFTNPTMDNAHAFLSTSIVKREGGPTADWPNIQMYLHSVGIYETLDDELSRLFGFDLDKMTKFLSPMKGNDGFFLMFTLVRPKSVGELRLKDKNMFSKPIINPKYLENPEDVKALVESIKFGVDLVEKSKSFKAVNAKLYRQPFPGCENFLYASEEYWACYIRQMGVTLYHPSGTCAMGKSHGDPKAVVDSKLRILGVNGVRVADCSVLRNIVNGNTNAPAILIGERAASFVQEYWTKQYSVSKLYEYYFTSKENFENQCYYTRLI